MTTNPFDGELAAHIAADTGEHVHIGQLDFDVWVYERPGHGWQIAGSQMLPQPMLDEIGTADVPPARWTVTIANGNIATFQPRAEVEDDGQRIPWEWLPEADQAVVIAHASHGWWWGGVEHHYDPEHDDWVAAA